VAAFESAVNDYNNLLLKAANELSLKLRDIHQFRKARLSAEDVAFMRKIMSLFIPDTAMGSIL